MKRLAELMSQSGWQRRTGLDLPVVDGTALQGTYDFDLQVAWIAGSIPEVALPDGCGDPGNSPTAALKLLGLSLKREKRDQLFIVADSALRVPTPN